MKMIRSRSMENMDILPEDAKQAISFLRLTLSEKLESQRETEFQSYIGKHHQFPYHKAVHLAPIKKSEPVPISKKGGGTPSAGIQQGKRYLTVRRRCEGSPSTITCNNSGQVSDTLVRSAPPEGLGFFQRFVPVFLRKRLDSAVPVPEPEVASGEPEPDLNNNQPLDCSEDKFTSQNTCHFVCTYTRMPSKMDNLIFMSMR